MIALEVSFVLVFRHSNPIKNASGAQVALAWVLSPQTLDGAEFRHDQAPSPGKEPASRKRRTHGSRSARTGRSHQNQHPGRPIFRTPAEDARSLGDRPQSTLPEDEGIPGPLRFALQSPPPSTTAGLGCPILRRKPSDNISEVALVELCVFVDRSGEEAFSERG